MLCSFCCRLRICKKNLEKLIFGHFHYLYDFFFSPNNKQNVGEKIFLVKFEEDTSTNTVFLSNLSNQRHRTVPNRTLPHRTANVTFFAHRCIQRYIEKYAVTSIVTINYNAKFDCHTNRHSYYHYRTLNNNASPESLQFFLSVTSTVTNIVTHFFYRHLLRHYCR